MERKGVIGAIVLVGVGIVLGTTAFRDDIAQATGLAQSVNVANTPAQAVPVREQNLDGGNIRVHEEGTVAVRSSDEEVSVSREFVSNTTVCQGTLYTVPAGKNLIVEYVGSIGHFLTASASDPAPPVPFGEVFGNDVALPLVFHAQLPDTLTGAYFFSASDDVHYVVPAGTQLSVIVFGRQAPCTSFEVSLGGYLRPSS